MSGRATATTSGGSRRCGAEWNGKYRDTIRDFWRRTRRADRRVRDALHRFVRPVRRDTTAPDGVVNLITVHDGFTLRDLVSYETKHNEANGEDNRDGTSDNRSSNGGRRRSDRRSCDPRLAVRTAARAAGDAAAVVRRADAARWRRAGPDPARQQQRLLPGQCQTWVDWPGADTELLAFTRRLVALRQAHPVFRRRRFLVGADAAEVGWYTPAGTAMTAPDWSDSDARCITVHLDGEHGPDRAEDGSPLVDDDLLVLVNGWWEPLAFVVPDIGGDRRWTTVLRTAGDAATGPFGKGATVTVAGQAVTVLCAPRPIAGTG